MKHLWAQCFKEAYGFASARYREGVRDPEGVVSTEGLAFLGSIGCSAQELYDLVEDAELWGEPDFGTALLITALRRDYFLVVQGGVPTGKVVPTETLPGKSEAVEGITWLPRLIEKARLKLRGEMAPDLMYCCGGDREFFRKYDVHPADFLREVWAAGEDVGRLVRFVRGG